MQLTALQHMFWLYHCTSVQCCVAPDNLAAELASICCVPRVQAGDDTSLSDMERVRALLAECLAQLKALPQLKRQLQVRRGGGRTPRHR